MPATTVLFFVDDVIGAGARAGWFLAAYFVAGGFSLPLWVALARRWGKAHAWLLGMAVSVIAFAWAAGLGTGDDVAFALICLASGLALGADLALPPAILADQLARGEAGAGACFGWWNFVTKANLALAAGLALPLLALLGYAPGRAMRRPCTRWRWCMPACRSCSRAWRRCCCGAGAINWER